MSILKAFNDFAKQWSPKEMKYAFEMVAHRIGHIEIPSYKVGNLKTPEIKPLKIGRFQTPHIKSKDIKTPKIPLGDLIQYNPLSQYHFLATIGLGILAFRTREPLALEILTETSVLAPGAMRYIRFASNNKRIQKQARFEKAEGKKEAINDVMGLLHNKKPEDQAPDIS